MGKTLMCLLCSFSLNLKRNTENIKILIFNLEQILILDKIKH